MVYLHRTEQEKENSRNQKGIVMKSDYRVRAEKFIRKMYPIIRDCKSPVAVHRRINAYNAEHHTNIIVSSGASRYALIYSDYVIKFDYGSAKEWAGGCEDEYQKYTEIISKSEYSYLFAEVTKIKIGRKPIYIMPRVNNVGKSYQYWGKLSFAEQRFIHDVTADMHKGNYGSYKRKPKIIDYAMAP